ncbi:MAG: hypothetical protein QM784_05830 [Polyangiaceae bacterium]
MRMTHVRNPRSIAYVIASCTLLVAGCSGEDSSRGNANTGGDGGRGGASNVGGTGPAGGVSSHVPSSCLNATEDGYSNPR